MTDTKKDTFCALIDELRAELSTTQLNCDMWYDRAEDMRNRLSVAQAENAKLRELVKEMRVCLEDECKRCHEWGDACDLEHRMRELGVEAD